MIAWTQGSGNFTLRQDQSWVCHNRPVCFQEIDTLSTVLLPGEGHLPSEHRCLHTSVPSNPALCMSHIQPSPTSSSENEGGECETNFGGPKLVPHGVDLKHSILLHRIPWEHPHRKNLQSPAQSMLFHPFTQGLPVGATGCREISHHHQYHGGRS